MAINPNNINLIDYLGLTPAIGVNKDWVLSIQEPGNGTVINSYTLQQLEDLILGNNQTPNGVLNGLQVSINNAASPKTLSVSPGQWRIDNTIYEITTNYVSNINAPSLEDRNDAIIADNTGSVYYQANYNGSLGAGEILVNLFTVLADGGDIEVGPTPTVHYAVMNSLNNGDLNITGQFMINGVPFSGGGSIDDNVISLLSTWSSQKINDVFAKKPDSANGVVIDVSDIANGNIEVSADDWTIDTVNYIPDVSPELFTGIDLSDTGKQRYIAFYGNTDNEIIKVEGVESEAAVMPDTPADSVPLGYTLITDEDAEASVIDDSNYAKLNGGNVFNGIQSFEGQPYVLIKGNTKAGTRYFDNSGNFLGDIQFENLPVFRGLKISANNSLPPDPNIATKQLLDISSETRNAKFYGTVTGLNPVNDQDFVTLNWLRTQAIQLANLGVGISPNVATFLTLALATASKSQMILSQGTTDYTGDVNGSIWNNGGEIKFIDNGVQNRLLKLDGNELLEGPTNRMVEVNQFGDISSVSEIIIAEILDVDLIDAIEGATYTNNRATISVTGKAVKQGQFYDDGTYTYQAINDNYIRRY